MELIKSAFSSIICWAVITFILLYVILKKKIYSFWQTHGVPYDDFTIPFGIFGLDFFTNKISLSEVIEKSYQKFKNYPFHGLYMFHNKILMINDLELVKIILIKDFNNFCDRGVYSNKKIDPLSENFFFLNGDKWRTIRAKLSPAFNPGRLKFMFPIVRENAADMIRVIDDDLKKSNILELKEILARYTTDLIFNISFGVNSKCLREPLDNEFRYYGDLFFKEGIVRLALAFFGPEILEFLKIPVFNSKITKYFTGLFEEMVGKRRTEAIKRNDILDTLIDLMDNEQAIDRNSVDSDMDTEMLAKRLEPLEAVAQAFTFFVAGFETTSSAVTHCLYELALNPDVQLKLHEEIDKFLDGQENLSLENLMQLQYLDMVFQETLRKHTPIAFLNRICLKDYPIPNSNFTIPKGMRIIISLSGIHRNLDFYPEPGKFDPTRFTKENIALKYRFSYIPFGEGPRICIGQRIGILMSKLAIFSLLANYNFSVCEKTPIPSFYSPVSIAQSPRDGVHLKVERRREIFI